MWAQLVRDRGGLPLAGPSDPDPGSAAFACVVVGDDDLLPLIARLDPDRPRFLLKHGRVGGAEGERGSLAIAEADAAAALDAALGRDALWESDPDLGVELLVAGAEGVEQNLLIPRFLYRRADRIYEYAAAMPDALRAHAALLRA